jgi:hypothetical protein
VGVALARKVLARSGAGKDTQQNRQIRQLELSGLKAVVLEPASDSNRRSERACGAAGFAHDYCQSYYFLTMHQPARGQPATDARREARECPQKQTTHSQPGATSTAGRTRTRVHVSRVCSPTALTRRLHRARILVTGEEKSKLFRARRFKHRSIACAHTSGLLCLRHLPLCGGIRQ